MVTSLILLLSGLIFIIIGASEYLHIKKLVRTGVKAEGIIFDTEASDSPDNRSQYPTVRFTTRNNDWVTEKYKIGVIPGLVKRGEKVKVFYNAANPSEFVIDSPLSNNSCLLRPY